MYYDAQLRVVTNPTLLGERESGGLWVVGKIEDDLGDYLRKQYWYATYKSAKLIRPAWKEHVTIVRNESVRFELLHPFYNKYRDAIIDIRIWQEPNTNGEYWWLPVESEGLRLLRSDLGLSREPKIPFHLSFGHTGVSGDTGAVEK